jgi:ABC-2 type transport system permease protein
MSVTKGNPYLLEAKYDLLRQLRIPGQFIGIPLGGVGAYALLLLLGRDLGGLGEEFLVRFAAFGVINVGLLAIGLVAASERAYGWIRLRQVAPMPPLAFFLGKVSTGAVMAALTVLGVLLVELVFGAVSWPYHAWVSLTLALVLGSLPFTALGLAAAYLARPNSAQLLITYIAAFAFSSVFLPLLRLPEWIQTIFSYLPSTLFIDLALGAVGLASPSPASFLMLTAYTVAFLLLAAWLFGRDEGSTFG